MIFYDSFKNHESHRADVGTMEGDEFKVKVFVFFWDDLRNDGLNLIKLDVRINASQLFRGSKSNEERLKRSNQVWSCNKREHQVIEGGSQQKPVLLREFNNFLEQLFLEV